MIQVAQLPVPSTPPPAPSSLDLNYLASQLMPLIGAVVAIVAGMIALRWFLRSPIGEAIAEHIRARTRRRWGRDGAGELEEPRAAALQDQVGALQTQVSELAERVDFAERLLAERRERKLSAGS
jgi:hypothetical protein